MSTSRLGARKQITLQREILSLSTMRAVMRNFNNMNKRDFVEVIIKNNEYTTWYDGEYQYTGNYVDGLLEGFGIATTRQRKYECMFVHGRVVGRMKEIFNAGEIDYYTDTDKITYPELGNNVVYSERDEDCVSIQHGDYFVLHNKKIQNTYEKDGDDFECIGCNYVMLLRIDNRISKEEHYERCTKFIYEREINYEYVQFCINNVIISYLIDGTM